MKRSKCILVCLSLLFAFLLTGCASSEAIYNKFSENFELNDRELELLSEGKLTVEYDKGQFESSIDYYKYLLNSYLNAGRSLVKEWGVIFACVSVAIGVIMSKLAAKSIQIRRFAWLVFILGIPFIVFCLIYAPGILEVMLQ